TDFNIINYGYAGLDGFFMLAPFVFLFLIPAITMRSFAEEKKTGTVEIILTKPLTDLKIILAKFFASLFLVFFSLLPTLIYFITINIFALPPGVDIGATWGSYIGLLFLSATFVAIGIFCSSFTDNQIVAFILSVFLCGFSYIGFDLIYQMFGKADLLVKSLGINTHYTSMSRGVIDTRDIIYYLSFISLFIILTKISIEKRKWSH
nr:ABC transporter permease subunit [Bacteroidales bacterium]